MARIHRGILSHRDWLSFAALWCLPNGPLTWEHVPRMLSAENVFPATDVKGNRWRVSRHVRDRSLIRSPRASGQLAATRVPWCVHTGIAYGENLPDIPAACTTRNFRYLVRGPFTHIHQDEFIIIVRQSTTNPCLDYIDGLAQERRSSSSLAMESRLSCTNPSIWGLPEARGCDDCTF